MAIDFPVVNSDPSLPWLNPDTGITYIYKDGAWRVLSSTDFEDLENLYVNVPGDTMTGELSLSAAGTVDILQDALSVYHDGNYNAFIDWGGNAAFYDLIGEDAHFTRSVEVGATGDVKITLNADGSASFGDWNNIGDGAGVSINRLGIVDCNRAPGEFAFKVYTVGSTTLKAGITADGDAQFAGEIQQRAGGVQTFRVNTEGSLFVGNPSGAGNLTGNNRSISLSADGSGSFTGAVQAANLIAPFIEPDSNNTSPSAYALLNCQNKAKEIKARINADGSSVLAGFMRIGSNVDTSNKGVAIDHNGGTYITAVNNNAEVFRVWLSGTQKVTFFGDGRATFAGRVTAPGLFFSLEPDNDDNYTTTTEEYIEIESYTGPLGNTLEREVTKTRDVRTYTGPTLDVKERLQNLIARLDAIEANEVVDDATDNSLLLAVAELTSRLNERDALITTLTTRIEALENA